MDYRTERLDDHTWLIEEYNECSSVYMYLLEGIQKAFLIDTGNGAVPLKAICRELTDLPVTVALTHGHADHIGGTGAFEEVWIAKEDEPLYRLHSEGEIRRIFAGDNPLPVKDSCELHFYETGMIFDLGGRTVELIPSPGHSVGSVCFLDREHRWLFTGDTCCKAHVLLQMEYAAPLSVFRDSIRRILDLRERYDTTWPGHHEKPVGYEVIEEYLTAADGLLSGAMKGRQVEFPMGMCHLLEYRDIGIEY